MNTIHTIVRTALSHQNVKMKTDTPSPIPANLVIGFLGAGKTSLIRHWLSAKPASERWAVLVNDFGDIGIDGALLDDGTAAVAEVTGGCICCSAAMGLRKALTELLRQKPDRLIIEASGLGHPAGVVDMLRGEGLREALALRAVIMVASAEDFTAERLARSQIYKDQFSLADVVVLSKADTAPERLAALRAHVQTLQPAKQAVVTADEARGNLALLDLQPPPVARVLTPFSPAPTNPAACPAPPSPEGDSRGWLFPPSVRFMRSRLLPFFHSLPDTMRAKGILRTGHEWQLFQWRGGQLTEEPFAWRRDSRIELISEVPVTGWETIEAQLRQTFVDSGQ